MGPKFSVITFNFSLGNSSVNKQKTENEKEKNGHTLGLTSTNSKVQITLNNITDSTHETAEEGRALWKPAALTSDSLSRNTEEKKMTIQGEEMKNGISFKE